LLAKNTGAGRRTMVSMRWRIAPSSAKPNQRQRLALFLPSDLVIG